MHDPSSGQNLLVATASATIGAGVVTSFAVSQGQHPLMALTVASIAVAFAIACSRAGIA
ncbi:hypothetical protein KR51_00024240 [Rubidibacter lacunae KORDI 51-2]|uniref:Uncharacterized protein n=1 Tax=Rubidibacter lacunae KORDI 51-2 TaxID=582515 RepID=U5DMT1_9CHRO|nr:hypothetical protein [Rubidibacter lacunae]ERN41005.1 hypothetical protein KR51_00024240 [Rubidibacter lacunae KORDI 51-2]